jgi:hypothetical protein
MKKHVHEWINVAPVADQPGVYHWRAAAARKSWGQSKSSLRRPALRGPPGGDARKTVVSQVSTRRFETRLRRSTRSGRLVRLTPAREAESGEAQTEQCDCGGFGHETDRIAVYREGVCAPAMAKRVRDQFKG